ncbi:MAG: EAL domain-containing protein [Pseudomonadota bacterium]
MPFRFKDIWGSIGQGASIQQKLALGFVFLFILILSLGSLSVRQLENIANATRQFQDQTLPKTMLVGDIERALIEHSLLTQRRVQTTDFRQLATIERLARDLEESVQVHLVGLRTAFPINAGGDIVDRISQGWARYVQSVDEVLALAEQGALRRAEARFADATEAHARQIATDVSMLGQFSRAEVDRLSQEAEAYYRHARHVTILVLVAGLSAVLAARIWISRHVSGPLLDIGSAMHDLTAGQDDTAIPDYRGRTDEIATLSKAAMAFRDSLVAARTLATDVNRERAWLAATVHNMPIGMAIFEASGSLLLSNQALRDVLNTSSDALTSGSAQAAFLAEVGRCRGLSQPDAFVGEVLTAMENDQTLTGVWCLADGRSVEVIIHSVPGGWMFICEDVTERTLAERNIYRMARSDPLTGLANRLAFQERLAEELSAFSPGLALMLIDLDRFKHINDTLGHPVGDKLLQQVGGRLTAVLGRDGVVARLGGDEFAAIQLSDDLPRAMITADEIVSQLSVPFDIDGYVVQIGGSVGISLAPFHSSVSEELLRNADLALYEAKDRGRGNFQLFDPVMTERQKALHELEQSLRKATSQEAFQVFFQPLIELDDQSICGAEALVRWAHPSRGLVSPDEFIPMAEELGLISEIGQTVLQRACAAATAWPTHMKVSVNLSPLQFQTPSFLSDTLKVLEGSGLDPKRLELEITESVFLSNTEQTLATLAALREAGVSVALDDFGTGYSSLRYLQSFPFDRVKIDASFVQGVPFETGAVAIVRAICSLAGTFGMAITAEGIETETQLSFVRKANIAVGQGFLFSRPVSERAFAALLSAEGGVTSDRHKREIS